MKLSNTNARMQIEDHISFKDQHGVKHGLRGHVRIMCQDLETGKVSLWDEDDNIIPISGYQWILMKMFDLYLDSSHGKTFETLTRDSTIEIPDLNKDSSMRLGVDPNLYSELDTNIPENHFIQGFMVGNGASSEDAITAKNTDYSFVKLRNPIPFQQINGGDSLPANLAGKYVGVHRQSATVAAKSYYIKKFEETPHISHSWWRSGQSWDYVDPVTQDDLGPDAKNSPKTNRIETYVSCSLTIDDTDCKSFFANTNNSQSAIINELGLVAYDAVVGTQSVVETLYRSKIKRLLDLLFTEGSSPEEMSILAGEIETVLTEIEQTKNEPHIAKFIQAMNDLQTVILSENTDYTSVQDAICSDDCIGVEAYFNRKGDYQYSTDKFLEKLYNVRFNDADEAQRIKLITYYTFKPIPIRSNLKWIIDYRIYAN